MVGVGEAPERGEDVGLRPCGGQRQWSIGADRRREGLVEEILQRVDAEDSEHVL